jgi:hypothetical protein
MSKSGAPYAGCLLLAEAPTPPQQRTGNPQQCRRHKALVRHTAASCFLSTRVSTTACQPSFSQLRRGGGRQDGGRNFGVLKHIVYFATHGLVAGEIASPPLARPAAREIVKREPRV